MDIDLTELQILIKRILGGYEGYLPFSRAAVKTLLDEIGRECSVYRRWSTLDYSEFAEAAETILHIHAQRLLGANVGGVLAKVCGRNQLSRNEADAVILAWGMGEFSDGCSIDDILNNVDTPSPQRDVPEHPSVTAILERCRIVEETHSLDLSDLIDQVRKLVRVYVRTDIHPRAMVVLTVCKVLQHHSRILTDDVSVSVHAIMAKLFDVECELIVNGHNDSRLPALSVNVPIAELLQTHSVDELIRGLVRIVQTTHPVQGRQFDFGLRSKRDYRY